jgi:hypothetical protein
MGPGTTLMNPVCIEKLEGNEFKEHQFVEAQTMQKDTREKNIVP